MATIKVKSFDDFKKLVDNNNLIVFYTIEADILSLFADDGNLYSYQLKVVNMDELELWFNDNFEQWTEVLEVKENGKV